jgi:hypothetical protein
MRRTVPFRSRFKMRGFWALALVTALAACQFVGLGGGDKAATDIAAPTALQGPAVEVTTLAPMGQAAAPAADAAKPKPAADAGKTAPAAEEAAPVVIKVKTPSQIACEKKGGTFAALPSTGAMTCQLTTRDGGKQCRRESDCDGVCLARSGTCAPVKPLLGCHDILQNDGRQVKLCID